MQQVLIEFTADASGIAPAEKALIDLTEQEKKLLDQSNKTAAAVTAQGKATTDSSKASTKSVEQLVASVKNLDKAMVGGIYKKTFDEIRQNLALTDKEMKAFYQNVIKNSRTQLLDSSLAKEDFDALHTLVTSSQQALDQLGNSEEKVGEKSKSMRAQLKELKNELQLLEDQGKDNTAEFEAMAVEAGRLQDQIGDTNARIQALASDTFVFDAIAGGIQGVAGAFAVAQGAAALFGADSEEVQQALLKVNAAMAILQGLQTVQNVLQAQSNVMIGLSVVETRALAIAQQFLAATTLESAAATGVLRAALIASGIGAIALVIGLVVSGLQSMNKEIENSTDRMDRLTKEADGLYEALNKLAKVSQAGVDRQIDIIKNEEIVKLLEAQGASQERINDAKKAGLNLQNDQLKLELFNIEESKKIAEDKTQFTQRELDVKAKIYQNDKAQLLLDIELAKAENERSLKSASAYADAEVARRKKIIIDNQVDSIKSIEAVSVAERNAIRAKLNEELKPGNKLTDGEREKLIKEANLAITENYKDTYNKIFLNRKNTLLAELAIVKEGSQEELDLQLRLNTQEKTAELNANEVTKAKSLEIEARYQKERLDLIKNYNKLVAENTLNTDVANTNTGINDLQAARVSNTNAELIRLQKLHIDQMAELEVISINYSVNNEELRRAKVNEVYKKALADKRKLEEDKIIAEIEARKNERLDQFEIDKINAETEAIRQGGKTKKQLRDEERKSIEIDQRELTDLIISKVATEEEVQKKITDIDKKEAQLRLNIARDEAEQKAMIIQNSEQLFQNLLSIATNISRASYDREISQVQELYDKKLIGEKEYNNRIKQLKRQEAIDAKKKAIFDVLIQQGPALIKGFTQGGITGQILAALTFASALAVTASAPIPQFKKGKIKIPGPGTETSDSILARISRGESVVNAKQTNKWEPALQAINNDKFEHYLKNVALPKFYPAMPSAIRDVAAFTQPAFSIDYAEMARQFSKELANNPMLSVSFDKDGFNTYMQQQNTITEIKNRDFEL